METELKVTTGDIDELLAFLPIFDAEGAVFVKEWREGTKGKDGTVQLPFPEYTDEVDAFFEILHKPCWFMGEYDPAEASKMATDFSLVERADFDQIRKALFFCARSERFADGGWDNVLKSGFVVALLKRLKTLKNDISMVQL